MNDKLYIVVRGDLPAGSQAVQGIHAAKQFSVDYPEIDEDWFVKSNYIAFLSVPDKNKLENLRHKAWRWGISCSGFREPDLNNELTAIALEPGLQSQKLCSKLKLALS